MGKPYEHLQRLRTPVKDETRPQPNTKYVESVADQLGLTERNRHRLLEGRRNRATIDATPVLTDDETRVYRSCVGARMHVVLDRADTQLDVHILGSYLGAPTTGAMEALRGVTRYLLGTKDAFIKLRAQSGDPTWVELVGYSSRDWGGDPASRKSQSSGHVDAYGCPMASRSRRQRCVGTRRPARAPQGQRRRNHDQHP